jgi:hypothetical protein
MTEESEAPRLRDHLREMGHALGAIGKDVEKDVADAPHLTKEATKGAFARAAGLKHKPIHAWSDPDPEPAP